MPRDFAGFKKYLKPLIEWAALGGLLFSIWKFPIVEYLFKLFSNTFIVGRSSFKVYLFVVFLFVLWKIFFSKKVFRKNIFPLHAFLVSILFLIGLVEFFLFYTEVYGHDPRFLSNIINVYVPPYSVSTTSLLHIHNAKAVWAYLFSLGQHAQFFYSFDPGAPFLGFYPVWLLLTQLFLFVLYIVSSFLLLFQFKEKLAIGNYFAFGLSLLVITKNLTDGGLLNGETWLFGLPVYIYFSVRGTMFPHEESPRALIPLLGVVLFFYASYSIILWRVDFPFLVAQADYIASLTRYLLVFIIMTGVSFLYKKIQKKPAEKEVIVLAGALLCFSFFIGNLCEIIPGCLSNDYHRMRNCPLAKDSIVVAAGFDPDVFDELVRDRDAAIVQKISLAHYTRARLRLNKEMTYYDLCKKTGINPSIGSVSVVDSFCTEGNTLSFKQGCWVTPFLKPNEITLAQDFAIKVSEPKQKRKIRGEDFFRQNVVTTLPGCTPILATARLNLMKEIGIRKAICKRHPLEVFRISKEGVLSREVE